MKIYSDYKLARTGQITADVTAIAAIVLFVILGVAVHGFIVGFADLGRQIEGVGTDFEQNMADAADTLGDVPLIGDGVRAPFDSASGAGGDLATAGRDQQTAVERGAVLLGVVVALVPIAVILRYWLLRRISFARKASEAAALAREDGGMDLLALRALASRPPAQLIAVDADPSGAWRRGDPAVIRSLATLSLREAGVRPR